MIFTVPEDFEGSCVLTTLKRAIWKGMTVSIYGNDLYAPDIKMAIERGILIPSDKNFDKEQINYSHDVMIVNKTDKVLVLGDIIMGASGSRIIDKDLAQTAAIISAEKNGFISIISDQPKSKKKKVKKTSKKKVKKTTSKKVKKTTSKKVKKASKKKAKKNVGVIDPEEYVPSYSLPETGADRKVKAKIWNFREQESEEAQIVPKTPDMLVVDKEETEEIEFVDEPMEAQKETSEKRKKTKKKVAKKKKAAERTIKKKGKATKKKKVITTESVGNKKIPKDKADVAIELDSRGRPIEGLGDELQHLIDSSDESEDMTFVDDEQAQERYENRTDMD